MRQAPEGHFAHRGGYADSRVRIGAISEPSAGRDEQLGLIFLNMRRAMNVSRETIARRLATRASTIEDFEAGAVTALPHWKETDRIVRGYCELLRLDPKPILWRIHSHLESLANQARPARAPQAVPPTGRAHGGPPAMLRDERNQTARPPDTGRRRRRARTLFALSTPIAILAGVVYAMQAVPQVMYPALAWLPDQVEAPVRSGIEYLVVLTAPRRDGLKWIEVSDPQLRKADKLPTSSR